MVLSIARLSRPRLAAAISTAALFCSGLTAAVTTPAVAAPAAPAAAVAARTTAKPPVDDGPPDGVYRVTLITGDQVKLTVEGGQYEASVVKWARRPDRSPEPHYQATAGPDGVFVIPEDAQAAIASGQVEKSLFDVAYLAAHGYADAKTDRLPVIVEYRDQPRATDAKAAKAAEPALRAKAESLAGSDVTSVLESIGGAGLSVPKAEAGDFWQSLRGGAAGRSRAGVAGGIGAGIDKVWLDREVQVSLDESVPLIGAPEAWAAGYDGSGVTVAILDTGIDATHPDLQGKVVASKSFVSDTVADGHGHGTHVASTVAGGGAVYKGVAPGARLAIGKVLNDAGRGTDSQVIAGMEWATEEAGADVVSISLGSRPTDGTDPASQAVNALTASTGALFVIAAGNSGPGKETVSAPGAATAALTVAATDKQDHLADFSSRGPRVGDGALKPDISAPGVDITAARAAGTAMGTPVDELYTTASGTSMATPHVSGAAAIVRQQHPDWPPERVKAALMSTSRDTGAPAYEQGAGRVDVARAVRQHVFATTANLDYGSVPVGGTEPISRQLEFSNGGAEAVTLTLAPVLRSPTGEPVPDGTLTVPGSVTVPAGGTAAVTATLTGGNLATGGYTGAVAATDDASGVRLTTPVAALVEIPKVKLTIRTLDRQGQPLGELPVWLGGSKAGWNSGPSSVAAMDVPGITGYSFPDFVTRESSVEEVWVVPGTYSISRDVRWWDDQRGTDVQGMLFDAQVSVRADTEVVLDARKAVPVTWRLPHRTTVPPENVISIETGVWDGRLATTSGNHVYDYVTPTEKVTANTFRVGLHTYRNMNPQVSMSVVRPGHTTVPVVPRRDRAYADRGLIMGNGTSDGMVGTDGGWVPFPAGKHTLRLVDAGYGRPEDLAGVDLRGKLALLRWAEDRYGIGIPQNAVYTDRIDNVQRAGAAGFVLFGEPESADPLTLLNPTYDAPAPFYHHWPPAGAKEIRIPELQVKRSVAEDLLAQMKRGPVTVEVRSDPQVRYIQTGSVYHDQQVPAALRQVLRDNNVAKVHRRLHSAVPLSRARMWGKSLQPGTVFRVSNSTKVAVPRTGFTEYIGPVSDGVLWSRRLDQVDGAFSVSAEPRTFGRPVRVREEWNTGLYTPGQVVLRTFDSAEHPPPAGAAPTRFYYCTMCRQGNSLVPNRYLTDAGGQVDGGGWTGPVRMFRADGTEIPRTRRGIVPVFDLPPAPERYTMTLDENGVSTRWSFTSAAPTRQTARDDNCVGTAAGWPEPCAALPLVYLSYDLGKQQRLDNTLPAFPPVRVFTVRVSPGASTEPTPKIAGLKLWTSVDSGDHWRRALAIPRWHHGGAERWFTVIAVTGGRPGAKLSLKAEAWDVAGNRIEQVVKDRLTLS